MKSLKSNLKILFNAILAIALGYGLYYFIFNVWLSSYTNHNESIEIPDLSAMSIQEATSTLDGLGLTYEIDSVNFDPNRKPYSIVDFYPHASSKVKEGRRIFIKANPKTYRPVELPDLIGKSKRLALTQLDISGLQIGNITYEPDLAKDAVLKILYNGRILKPGDILQRFSKVDLVLGRGMMAGVKTPNFIGLDLNTAKQSISDNFFEIGQIKYLGNPSDTIGARVVYQFPFPSEEHDQGQPVDLWLSNQPTSELKEIFKQLDKEFKRYKETPEYDNSYDGESFKNVDLESIYNLPQQQNTSQENNRQSNSQNQTPSKETPKQAEKEIIIE